MSSDPVVAGPLPRDPARFFDAVAGRYDRVYALPSDVSRQRLARVVRELPPPPAHVLDLGVGTGREIPALLDAGYRLTGVDASRAMLERCARRSRPVPLVHADFWTPLPFEDGSFDAALALHGTLAHPPDEGAPARLAADLARVVRAGGAFVAEAPSPSWLDWAESAPAVDGREVRRTGPSTCVFEDRAAGASIAARVLAAGEWIAAFGAPWSTRVEPLGGLEWIVVARR